MPVLSKCPYVGEWESIDEETGAKIIKSLCPDEILLLMADGLTVAELAEHFKAPIAVIEHVITLVPHMMVWRG